jgi:hypothetical protein
VPGTYFLKRRMSPISAPECIIARSIGQPEVVRAGRALENHKQVTAQVEFMNTFFKSLLVGTVLAISGTAMAAGAADPVVGTWVLNVAKSKFSPGPAPKAQTRTYAATADGIDLVVTGTNADGSAISQKSSFKYDGKDYAISGSADYDTLSLKKIDDHTVESVQKKAGKAVGKTKRTVSKDGKVLTLTSKGHGASGGMYDNVMVFDRK